HVVAVVVCDRGMVGGLHAEADGGHGGVGNAVVGAIRETVGAGITACGVITERAVAIQIQCAMERAAYQHCDQAVSVSVSIITQHAGPSHGEGCILGHVVAVVVCDRGMVGGLHTEADRGRGGVGDAVAGAVSAAV